MPRRSPSASIDRIAALGGGVAVQHRMAYQGEYFVERYGAARPRPRRRSRACWARASTSSAGTDATRVASYNPWVSLAWLVTGKTVGGLQITPQRNCLDRETALRMWTEKVTWFSNEDGKKGVIKDGQLADLIVPDRDFFACPEREIADTTVAAHRGGRQGGLRRRRVRRVRRGRATAGDARLVAGAPLRRLRRVGREGRRAAAGRAAPGGGRVRLRQRLRRARPRPRDGMAQPLPVSRPARASGAHSAAPAGPCDGRRLEQRPATRAGTFAPLRQTVFAVLWAATVLGNIGSFMRDVASAWLVTELSASPTTVALIQTAATLPVFLLAIPAGVLSDILDRRRFLIVVQLVLAARQRHAAGAGAHRHAHGRLPDRPDLPRRRRRRADGADLAVDRARAGAARRAQERGRAELAGHQRRARDRAGGGRPAARELRCRRHLRPGRAELRLRDRGPAVVAPAGGAPTAACPSISSAPSRPACATRAPAASCTWCCCARRCSSCSRARSGRCCRWWRGRCWAAPRASTACCSARSVPVRSRARS